MPTDKEIEAVVLALWDTFPMPPWVTEADVSDVVSAALSAAEKEREGFAYEYRAVCNDGNRPAGLRCKWNSDVDFARDYARQFFGPREWWIERRLVGPPEKVEES